MFKKTTISILALIVLTACSGNKKRMSPVRGGTPATGSAPSDTVYFNFDCSELGAEDMKVLQQQACWINAKKQCAIIEGHCDNRGTREYNLGLGARRAEAVKCYLESQGVAPGCLQTTSYGKERPVDTGHNEAAYAKNRRAVTATGCRK